MPGASAAWLKRTYGTPEAFRATWVMPAEDKEDTMRYQTVEELPDWARPTIDKLIKQGILRGDGEGLSLSLDMIRILVLNDRAGLHKAE